MLKAQRLIAVLDDEVSFRVALMRLLKAHGYAVASFATGQQLLAETAHRQFDCLLLDLHMPGMTGFDVMAALRQDPNAPPVIVITAHDEPDFASRAVALNVFEWHLKPVGAPALLGSIERALVR